MKKSGFTLAEVLITLGIIGVVAAMTIPGLITNYKAARLKSQFTKVQSEIAQAVRMMKNDDISLDAATYAGSDSLDFYNTFYKYFRVLHMCDKNVQSKKNKDLCYTQDSIKNLFGESAITYAFFDDGQFILMDGALLIFNQNTKGGPLYVSVDINGIKAKPNRLGYDVFVFQLINEEFLPAGAKGTSNFGEKCDLTSKSTRGFSCTSNAVSDADYFKKLVQNVK